MNLLRECFGNPKFGLFGHKERFPKALCGGWWHDEIIFPGGLGMSWYQSVCARLRFVTMFGMIFDNHLYVIWISLSRNACPYSAFVRIPIFLLLIFHFSSVRHYCFQPSISLSRCGHEDVEGVFDSGEVGGGLILIYRWTTPPISLVTYCKPCGDSWTFGGFVTHFDAN